MRFLTSSTKQTFPLTGFSTPITASNLPLPNENTDVPHNDINSFDSFYQNKISETCDDILMLEKNAATIVQADIENLYKGSFVREFAARSHITEDDAREQLRLDLAGQLHAWGMKCINKRHYALPREIKHIIRMDFYGTVDKIDEKKDGKSSKKLSETYRQRNPEKTAGVRPADYDLSQSPSWTVFRQFRSFRLLERNLPELLIKEGISPQDFKRLNAYDFSQILYNRYIAKSKPDAERMSGLICFWEPNTVLSKPLSAATRHRCAASWNCAVTTRAIPKRSSATWNNTA